MYESQLRNVPQANATTAAAAAAGLLLAEMATHAFVQGIEIPPTTYSMYLLDASDGMTGSSTLHTLLYSNDPPTRVILCYSLVISEGIFYSVIVCL